MVQVEITYQMVLSTLQTAGLLVGIYYYLMVLRNQEKNRKITLTTTMLQPFMTNEGYENIMDLLGLQWDSVEDFMQKYDSRVDRKNAARRMALWNTCNTIGGLYRDGMLDLKTVFNSSGGIIQVIWVKYKPIIEHYRSTDFGLRKAYEDFEYLAIELEKYNPMNR